MTATAPDAAEFRRSVGRYPTGVAVVTCRAADGSPQGITVNSFATVSLEPLLVLWSISRSAGSAPHFIGAAHHAIHLLAAGQADVARRFATRGAAKFAGIVTGNTQMGDPALRGCLMRLDCRVHARHEAGDHVILVGLVAHLEQSSGRPLAFCDGAFTVMPPPDPACSLASDDWVDRWMGVGEHPWRVPVR